MSESRIPSLNRLPAYSVALLAGSLLLPATLSGKSTAAENTATPETNPQLYFDDLRPGRHYVWVYPGVRDTRRDRLASGAFLSGDNVDAVCKIEGGRLVQSNPRKGERPRRSREWFKVLSDGPTYASGVYTRPGNAKALRDQLPDCKRRQ